MMTLEEKEKPVIQQGAYIVIKSHVKNANTHHPLSLAVATLPVRTTVSISKKKKKKNTTQILNLCSKHHT